MVHALELAEALHGLGHQPVLHAPDPAQRGFFRKGSYPQVSVLARDFEGSLPEMVEQRVREYVRHFSQPGNCDFDVFHAQDSISGNALADLTALGCIPGFTRTVHHLDSFDDARVATLQTRAVTAAAQVFCVSEAWKQKLFSLHRIHAELVPSGVGRQFSEQTTTIDERVHRRFGLTSDDPVFLVVGGVEPRKNTIRILQAFLQIVDMHPRARLLIVGGATLLDHSRYGQQFQKEMANLPLRAVRQVTLAGVVPDAEMPSLFRLADCLVFPSIEEGFGLVVLESMVSGTPVLTSRIRPFVDHLPTESCLWADPESVPQITAGMLQALDPATAVSLRRRGLEVAKTFSWKACAQQHVHLYRCFSSFHVTDPAPTEGEHFAGDALSRSLA